MDPVQFRKSFLQTSFCVIAAAILIWSSGAPVEVAAITVNSSCSFADAITAANTDRATGGCLAGSGADTITLTVNVALNGDLLEISSAITIEGGGYTIDAKLERRHFLVQSSGTLTLTRMTLKRGKKTNKFSGDSLGFHGGSILNSGNLTVKSVLFTENRAHLGASIFTEVGSTTRVFNSTFTGNFGQKGSAFYAMGDVDVFNSTFNGRNDLVDHDPATVIALNRSAGPTFRIYNSILVNHGQASTCRFNNRVVSVNNYSNDASCAPAFDTNDGPVNLGALTGSPGYFPLQAGSLALGRGASAHCPATDQAGNSRPNPAGSSCDLGAIESSLLSTSNGVPTDVPTATPANTVTATAAVCNLADQIRTANTGTAHGGCSASSNYQTITLRKHESLTENLPEIIGTLTINGQGYTINAASHRAFRVTSSGTLTLNRVVVRNAMGTTDDSGALTNLGTATVNNSAFIENRGRRHGGAILNSGTLTVNSSAFVGNIAGAGWTTGGEGGAIYISAGSATITNSTFHRNSLRFWVELGC